MKKLEKLNAKQVESLASIKGGLMNLSQSIELADTGGGGETTTHKPTYLKNFDCYQCDHKKDK